NLGKQWAVGHFM
uniref:[Asn3,Lys6,Phe13]3-14-bombesin n=1 Tax=Pelophylax ridibundus TaxID=8406 RepID=BOMB_PELRI|nr:RecName: Full=[Asn3,Lys6,Phe13]3-14-bombesin [Pelophylax ridibundus]